jgi:prepilin-type N-terminal cleavage/methylation domain-containing protein
VNGFTLIELLMVITLMSIITSVAIWRMGPAIDHARVRRAASIMAADLQYAQMISARLRQPVVVLVNGSLRMYAIRDRTGTTIFRQRFVGPDTDYGVGTLGVVPVGSVELFPNGVATQGITVTFGTDGYTRQVRLSRAGMVRVVAQ